MKRNRLSTLILSMAACFLLSIDIVGQCVHLKRAYTQFFPYSQVWLHAADDMTGDGVPDLIASRTGFGGFQRDQVYIIPNNGSGGFGSPIIINAPLAAFYIEFAIGRVNNDALKDFVFLVGSGAASEIRSYINNGDGTFTQSAASPNLGIPRKVLDLDGDGFGDMVFESTNNLAYRPGVGDGTFGATVTIPNSGGAKADGDFNADGKIDAISKNVLLTNQGNGTFASTDVSAFFTSSRVPTAVRDFNGDGRSDVLTSWGEVLLKTDTSFSSSSLTPLFTEFADGYTWIVGNFSGNSAPDIVFNDDYRNRKIVFTNSGSGVFTGQVYDTPLINTNAHHHAFGDFDNDGKEDLIKFTSLTANARMLLPDVTSFTLLKNVCTRPGQPSLVDFDRSGTTDFSYWNPATGDWTFRTNSDSFLLTETVNWGLGSLGDIPTPGDFDGDGITDRAVFRNSTGVWYMRMSSNQGWFVLPFGLTGDKPVAADYDGDTISDIAVFRPSDGNWHVWYMGTQSYGVVHFGANGDKPTPADFDGDLKTDFAVFRPSTGTWYYLRSSDGNFAVFNWGLSADKPVPGDYDGDGKADVAVHRGSDRTLYILRSQNLELAAYAWGTSGDVPVISDFDGDFVADFVVYRPSTGAWWIAGSSAFPTIFGGPGTMPTSSTFIVE
jgi:hypothetical protein